MNLRSQKIGIYCGWAFLVLFMVGFLIVAHFFPPPGPWESAHQIQERFIGHLPNELHDLR